ncbi:hypothetical protein KSP40_PGU018731 [Platanthera guangdongensis]|uniref:EF-hand domain-containing protein n=1 Tax=Platanthera guangdongensis TaxID=2320717 RepID=A0ABR2M820_9ASPA
MASVADPFESFLNDRFHAVGAALSPIESGVRWAVKDLESRFTHSGNALKCRGTQKKLPVGVISPESEKTRCSNKKGVNRSEKMEGESSCANCEVISASTDKTKASDSKKSQSFWLERNLGIKELDDRSKGIDGKTLRSHVDYLNMINGVIKGRKEDFDGFLSNIRFARVGMLSGLACGNSSVKDGGEICSSVGSKEEHKSGLVGLPNIGNALISIPLSNVERFKSTISTVSIGQLMELVPHLGRISKEHPEKKLKDHPDKKKLFSVQDFFRYAESEGQRFFEELDRDRDGRVTLEDLEIAMRKRRLPKRYAQEFFRRTRRHIFSKSIGWKQFLSLMEQREPTILRAYTMLCLSKSGTLQRNQILTSLRSAGLPANEDNAVAMMQYLNATKGGSISYSHFRNFMLLLPRERLQDDPRCVWFEAATVFPVSPPVELATENILKSALAGGLACAISTSMLHPLDTTKTLVQATTLSFPELLSRLPQIGLQGLYRGSIPAIIGQFSSHGLRTGIFEASKLLLTNVAPTLPEFQVQSVASWCSTLAGTAVRIPCEVLKQQLQAGLFDNAGVSIAGTFRQEGIKGFFREPVPHFVAKFLSMLQA